MQVEGQFCFRIEATGERVSNAYVTWPQMGDSPGKLGLIPHKILIWHHINIKGEIRLWMGVRSIS